MGKTDNRGDLMDIERTIAMAKENPMGGELRLVAEIERLLAKLAVMESELADLRAYKEAAIESQEPVIRISGGRVVDFNPNYGGSVSEGAFYAKPVPADKPEAPEAPKGTNRYGLDIGYLSEKLGLLLRDIDSHKPDEAARVLARLSKVADESVLREPEFSDRPAVAVPDGAIAMLNQIIAELEGGFVSCQRCGDQEETANLDCMYDLKKLCNLLAAAPSHSQKSAEAEADGMVEFITDLKRSREKYPNNERMFDGLIGEVYELKCAYSGDGDIRAEAFDVAVCAFRIATEGDAGGNTMLEESMKFWKSFLGVACDNIGK